MLKLDMKKVNNFLAGNFMFICILIAYIVVGSRNSMTISGLILILKRVSILSYAVAGMMVIRIVGEINLGTSGELAMIYFLLFYMWKVFHVSLPVLFVMAVILALLLSLIYFLLNHYARIPILYFSIPLGTVLIGLSNYLSKYFNIMGINTADIEYKLNGFFETSLWLWIWILVFAGLIVFLRVTPIGRSFYVVGAYKDVAQNSGMPIAFIKQFAITMGVLCIAFTAVLNFIKSEGNMITYTNTINYDVLVASCIGEGDFLSGKGTLSGALKGALGMILLNMLLQENSYLNSISLLIKAAIFLISLSISRFSR